MQRNIFLAFLAWALWLISSAASANLVVNGGFESGDFTDWTRSGNEDLTFVDGTPHSGTYAAWLGPEGTLGFLSQQLSTAVGSQYALDFWVQHEPFGTGTPNMFQVFWADNPIAVPGLPTTNLGDFDYTEYDVVLPVAAAASTELKFGFREDTDYFQLDDVSVEPVSLPVPEPSIGFSLVLAAYGMLFGAKYWGHQKSMLRCSRCTALGSTDRQDVTGRTIIRAP